MLKFNDYLKEAALSAKQKKIAAIAGDKDKIDAADLAALRAGKKPVDEASCSGKYMKKEELVGKQHKLDKNKNGKLDAHDFKLLRKEETDLDEDVKYIKRKDGKLYAVDHREGPIKNTHLAKDAAYVQTNLTKHLRKHAGLSPDSHVYFDDADLVHGDKTVMHNAIHPKSKHTVGNLVDALKKHVKVHKEEVEQIDELSKKTLGSYTKKAANDLGDKAHELGQNGEEPDYEDDDDKSTETYTGALRRGVDNRQAGIKRAVNKITKEEIELDEGRMKDLDYDLKNMGHDEFHKQYGHPKHHYDPTNFKKPVEPGKGMDRARALAQRGMQSLSKEEVERIEEKLAQLDELSPATLKSYKKGIARDLDRASDPDNYPHGTGDEAEDRKLNNRVKGDELANKKLKAKGVNPYSEEVEQIDEYIDMPDKNAVDRERDELKNFHGYKKNAGKHVATIDKDINTRFIY